MIALLASALLPLASQAAADAPAPDRLAACVALVRRDSEEGLNEAESWLEQAKGSERARAGQCLGAALVEFDQWAEAEKAFMAARKALDGTEPARAARLAAMAGNAALADGRYDAALDYLDLALADAGTGGDATLAATIQLDRARALVPLDRAEEAVDALEAARTGDAANADAWLFSATLARRMGALVQAQQFIEQAALLRPVDLDIGLEAGVIAMLAGHEEAARKSWQSVIEADPASTAARSARSYLAQIEAS